MVEHSFFIASLSPKNARFLGGFRAPSAEREPLAGFKASLEFLSLAHATIKTMIGVFLPEMNSGKRRNLIVCATRDSIVF